MGTRTHYSSDRMFRTEVANMKTLRNSQIFLLVLSVAGLSAFLLSIFHEQQIQDQTESQLMYTNPYYGFRIMYPSDWNYSEYEIPPNATVFPLVNFAPPVSVDPSMETSLQVGIETLQDLLSLDLYVRNMVDSYRASYENFTLVSANTNASLAGKPGYELVFTYDSNYAHARLLPI